MAYCKECGSQLSEQSNFCRECGGRVQDPIVAVSPGAEPAPPSGAPVRMSGRSKIWLLSVIVFIILCTAAYKMGEHFTSKERLIGKLETALNHKDMKKAASLLVSADPKLDVNEKTLAALGDYLESEPDERKRLIQDLNGQAEALDRSKDGNADVYRGWVHLEKKGKTFLVYDHYRLVLEPVFITLETNYVNAELYVGNQLVGTADKPDYEQKFGPYLPGKYTIAAKLKTDLVDLVHSEDITLLDADADYSASLLLDGEEVTVDTGLGDTQGVKGSVIINGKDTGIDPYRQATFGPVTTDGSMSLSIRTAFPWGTVTTPELAIDSDYIEVNAASDENFEQSIIDQAVKNNEQMLLAYTSGDVQKMEAATDTLKESVRQRIAEDREYGTYYQGRYMGAAFDVDTMKLSRNHEGWEYSVDANIRMLEDYFYEDETPSLEENSRTVNITLVYDGTKKGWYVDAMRDSYGFGGRQTKDTVSKDTGVHTAAWVPKSAAAAVSASAAGLDYSGTLSFMSEYLSTSVEAMNGRLFDQVAPLIDPSGPAYKESANYIDHLETKGITEYLNSFELVNLSRNADGSLKATTSENYTINYQDGSVKNKSFISEYRLVTIDGMLKVNQLISTKEQ